MSHPRQRPEKLLRTQFSFLREDERASGGSGPHRIGCSHPGCTAAGEYRAPKNRFALEDYRWLCLEHVREFNQSWDFYRGMSEAEIERERRHDAVWGRPSWPLGVGKFEHRFRARVHDFFSEGDDVYMRGQPHGDGPGEERGRRREERAQRQAAVAVELQALEVLGLEPPVTFDRIKARYRELVKIHHPDANGGAKEAEEMLKRINLAYSTLRSAHDSLAQSHG